MKDRWEMNSFGFALFKAISCLVLIFVGTMWIILAPSLLDSMPGLMFTLFGGVLIVLSVRYLGKFFRALRK